MSIDGFSSYRCEAIRHSIGDYLYYKATKFSSNACLSIAFVDDAQYAARIFVISKWLRWTNTLVRTGPLLNIDCIFCGMAAISDIAIRENGFTGRQCRSCGLIFVSPRPSFNEILDLYGHDEAHVSAESLLSSGFSKRLYARNSLRIIREFSDSGSILEIGAGGGYFLDEARKQGFHPFAIEFNSVQGRHIRETLGIPCVANRLADDPYPGHVFDVIYHCDVVSHFYDPISEFQAFRDALKDGGLLVFETGNLGDVDHRYFNHFSRFQYPDHLFFFSSDNISKLLAATGFELLAIHRYSILADLWIGKFRARTRKVARKLFSKNREAPPTAHIQAGPRHNNIGSKRSLFGLAKLADQYVNYLIRYRLGRVLPKGRRPQTMIVVARKSRAC